MTASTCETSTVYFDLDGVLADFVRGSFAFHGKSLPMKDVRWDFPQQLGFPATWAPEFWAPLGRDFWANLEPLPDGMRLLRIVEEVVGPARVAILSSPCDTDGCDEGKRAWVRKHLPEYKKRTFLGADKHVHAAGCKVLVDDHGPNCDKFVAAGGRALLVPRPWNERIGETDEEGYFDPERLRADLERAGVVPKKG